MGPPNRNRNRNRYRNRYRDRYRNRYRDRYRDRKEVTPGHDEPDGYQPLDWLRRLGGWGYQIREDQAVFGNGKNDLDPDSDFDLDQEQPYPGVTGDA